MSPVYISREGTESGFEHLTYVPIDLEAIDTEFMKPEAKDLLNRYHAEVYKKIEPLIEDQDVKAWLKEATRAI